MASPAIDAAALAPILAAADAGGGDGCASVPKAQAGPTGSAPTTSEKLADRWLSCLQHVAVLWAAYVSSPSDNTYAPAAAMYGYAAGAMGASGRKYLDGALGEIDWSAIPAAGPEPAIKALATVKSAASVALRLAALHTMLRDAYAANLATLIPSILGSCGSDCLAFGPSDIYDFATPVAGCEYYIAECGPDAARVWRMYAATGDVAFYRVVLGLRDHFVSLGMATGGWTLTGIRAAFYSDLRSGLPQ
jgi:hypothetical protein